MPSFLEIKRRIHNLPNCNLFIQVWFIAKGLSQKDYKSLLNRVYCPEDWITYQHPRNKKIPYPNFRLTEREAIESGPQFGAIHSKADPDGSSVWAQLFWFSLATILSATRTAQTRAIHRSGQLKRKKFQWPFCAYRVETQYDKNSLWSSR